MKRAGGGNYFDELLARIRDIRSSEKVFYRKVLEIYELPITFETGEGVEIAKVNHFGRPLSLLRNPVSKNCLKNSRSKTNPPIHQHSSNGMAWRVPGWFPGGSPIMHKKTGHWYGC